MANFEYTAPAQTSHINLDATISLCSPSGKYVADVRVNVTVDRPALSLEANMAEALTALDLAVAHKLQEQPNDR